MRTDGMFVLHQAVVPFNVGQVFNLRPFGDVHRDSSGFCEEKWAEFLESSRKLKNGLFLGMGDYLDCFSTSERTILGNDGIHDSTMENFEKEAMRKIGYMAKELGFMKGKLIGMLGGNHFIRFRNGDTSDTRLARLLGCNYLGSCAAIRLMFKHGHGHNASASVDIFAHHGKGGGTTDTGRLAAVEKMSKICEADIFLMGDNHARGVIPLGDKLRIDRNKQGIFIKSRRAFIGRTGSFLRAYVSGKRSYVVDGCMPPASLGWIEFTLEPRRIQGEGKDRTTVIIGAVQ